MIIPNGTETRTLQPLSLGPLGGGGGGGGLMSFDASARGYEGGSQKKLQVFVGNNPVHLF